MIAQPRRKEQVIVIGSGLAGLTAAYLIHNDLKCEYDVKIIESGSHPSLDAITLPTNLEIDIPMRQFSRDYYRTLYTLYKHLNLPIRQQKFTYIFTTRSSTQSRPKTYHTHPSNFHSLPAPIPGVSLLSHITTLAILYLAYIYFALCILLLRPGEDQAISSWLDRSLLPEWVVKGYFLPIFSTIGTCSSAELLASPAGDLITYRRALLFRRLYVVSGGVSVVRQRLLHGIPIRLNRHVNRVHKTPRGLSISWYGDGGEEEVANAVIFAIPPNAVAGIYAPLAQSLSQIPTAKMKVYAHTNSTILAPSYAHLSRSFSRAKDHVAIQLTTTKTHTSATEVRAGVMVSTTPQLVPGKDRVVMGARYTRVLRTPEIKKIANALLYGGDRGGRMEQ